MPPTIVQSKATGSGAALWRGGGVSPTVVLDAAPQAGNLLVAILGSEDGASGGLDFHPTGFTDLVNGTVPEGVGQMITISTKLAGVGESATIACATSNGQTARALQVYELSGATPESFGAVAPGVATDDPLVGPTLSSRTNGLLLAGIFARSETYEGTPVYTPQAPLVTDTFGRNDPGRGILWTGHQTVIAGASTTPKVNQTGATSNGKQNARVAAIFVDSLDAAEPRSASAPRLVVEYLTNNSSTFGPGTVDGVIHDALSVGWSWYSRFPANAYFTLKQDSPHNARLSPLLTHIRISYTNPANGYTKVVFTGRLGEPSSSGQDVVWNCWNYLAELSLSRSGYRTLYPNKLLGTEIVLPEWTAARTATFSLLNHVATGTIQNPLGSDGVTTIKTDARFGVIDVPRLLLMFDLSEIGRANTINNVTFEITRETPTFNFWKNRGSAITGESLTYPGSLVDYRYIPGFAALRNDLATVGTTSAGGATEIVKTDEANAATYGRRQDVFSIKTLSGLAGAATETDAQNAITARAVKEATALSKSISVDLRLGHFEPFDGWEIEDTVRVQIARGRDNLDAMYRIVGMRAVADERGYHPTLMLQLPTI